MGELESFWRRELRKMKGGPISESRGEKEWFQEREFRGAWTLRSEEKGGCGEGGAVEVTGEKARGGSCLKEETNLLSDPGWTVLRPSEVSLESPCLWLNPSYSFFFSLIRHLLNTYCVPGFMLPTLWKFQADGV